MGSPRVDSPEWAAMWLALAGQPREYDLRLGNLWRKPSFAGGDIARIIEWKLKGSYGPRQVERFRRADPAWASSVVTRALSLADDLAAVMTLTALPGVGVPVASAILTVHDPDRFTIADQRAWKTVVGPLKSLWEFEGRPWPECWLAYLDVCRRREQAWGLSLREVDYVLYLAKGRQLPERAG